MGNSEPVDEIKQYSDGRHVSACEAISRIYGFKVSGDAPTVVRLQLHLEDRQSLTYQDGAEADALNDPRLLRTTLIAYFDAVSYEMLHPLSVHEIGYFKRAKPDEQLQLKPVAHQLTYQEFCEFYTYDEYKRTYHRRKKRENIIGRIYYAHPTSGERFYLRMLLINVPGATSFEYLRTVNGVTYSTFKEACFHRGYLRDDNEWDNLLEEIALEKMPFSLRHTFAIILMYNSISNPLQLWNKYKDSMTEDYIYSLKLELGAAFEMDKYKEILYKQAEYRALQDINNIISSASSGIKNIDTFGLKVTVPDDKMDRIIILEKELATKKEIQEMQNYYEANVHRLNNNAEQKKIFDVIIEGVKAEKPQLYHIDGPGGCGKTFLFNMIIAYLKANKFNVIVAASSGRLGLFLSNLLR